jgi:peptidoglycan/xylan/chitin deacetylase (PgdA/CDA1 family)
MFYPVRSPSILHRLCPSALWKVKTDQKEVYLTFDDGPHPVATPFALQQLRQFNAKATFFCIGRNVQQYPDIFRQVQAEGHALGNHTFDHLNGWKTPNETYFRNIEQAAVHIPSRLFRPPYGRIGPRQLHLLKHRYRIVLWDVLSGDFDESLAPRKCLENVLQHTGKGSIIVFHDSTKAYERMQYALPALLEHLTAEGFRFRKLDATL